MKKKVLSIGLVILGLAWGGISRAQPVWVQVTGKGYPPKKEISEMRKRLLARRAAVVDAYRLLADKLGVVSDYVIGGSGYKQTRGFIKAAEIKDVRYFSDGKVEVDLILLVRT